MAITQNQPGDPKPPTDGDKDKATVGKVVIEVDGEKKEFGPKDVENLIAQQASVTQKAQKIAAIEAVAQKYGLDPEGYISHAEGAFQSLTKLLDQGIVDSQGNFVGEKKADEPKEPTTPVTPSKPKVPDELNTTLETITKALGDISKKVDTLESGQTGITRDILHTKLKAKHPELSDEDVSKVFAAASRDPNKNLWEHAKDVVGIKQSVKSEMEKQFAEKYGIDLEKWNENKIKEQEAEGGAGAILGERKVSLFKKPGEKNTVTAKEAMAEYIGPLRSR